MASIPFDLRSQIAVYPVVVDSDTGEVVRNDVPVKITLQQLIDLVNENAPEEGGE